MNKLTVFAPATIANVSCAFDIMGFSLDGIGDKMTFKKSKVPGIKIKMLNHTELPEIASQNVAGVVAKAMLEVINPSYGVEIELLKGIKPGSGIGSSAASAAGAAFGMNLILDKPFKTNELVEFAMLGEALASGVEHADNVAPALMGGITLVRNLSPLDLISLPFPKDLIVSILHPLIEVETKKARKLLKDEVLLTDAVKQWGNIAGLISGLFLSDFDLIGRSMKDVIVEPVRSILIPLFESLKTAALNTGAIGCGISGSGPSVFAFSKGSETGKKVSEAMAEVYKNSGIEYRIYTSGINKEGVKILDVI